MVLLRHRVRFALAAALATLLLGMASAPGAHARPQPQGEPIVLVVSPELRLTDLSRAELRRAFGGDATYAGTKRLVPFNYAPGDPLRVTFDSLVLGLSKDEVARYWVDRKIRGQSAPPRTVPSPAFMVAVAARLVGAIGYIPESALSAKVRPLTVEGIAYDDPRYPLRAELSGGHR